MKIGALLCSLALVTLAACTPSTPGVKKMTIKGRAVTGVNSTAPVVGGTVSLLAPGPNKWQRLTFNQNSNLPNIVKTGTDGSYTFTIDITWLENLSYEPVFLAVSDEKQTFTLLSTIPAASAEEGVDLPLDTSPQTTVAGLWHCPHGVFAQPDYGCAGGGVCQHGATCWQDPGETRTTAAEFGTKIGIADDAESVPEPDPTNWGPYSDALLKNPALLAYLNERLRALGLPEVTDITKLSQGMLDGPLPAIPTPSATDANDGTVPADTGSGSSGATCTGYLSCTKCSINTCSDGTTSYYQTSGGTKYYCASTSNCTSAANKVVAACCSRSEAEMAFGWGAASAHWK